VNKHVDPAGNSPKGLLFHASGPIDGGWGVIDFWESRDDFDAFQPRIGAAVAAAGAPCREPRTSSSSRFTRLTRASPAVAA
jgi:hypothetical protein